jgi:hypothetical protein
MPTTFVITESCCLAESLGRYLRYAQGSESHRYILPKLSSCSASAVLTQFRRVADWIDWHFKQIGDASPFGNVLAIIDLCDPELPELERLDTLSWHLGSAAVVGMLILTFPEFHWALLTPYRLTSRKGKCNNGPLFKDAHIWSEDLKRVLELHEADYRSLFDPTGLRNLLRSVMQGDGKPKERLGIPKRQGLAAAIDEERPYVYFNAYVAYRFGFRCHTVSSLRMMERVFQNQTNEGPATDDTLFAEQAPTLLLEDMYLSFADRRSDGVVPLSNLRQRDEQYPQLGKAEHRIVITVGRHSGQGRAQWHRNREYLKEQKAQGKWTQILFKPFSGIFDLWHRSGMARRLRGTGGVADGFNWPPPSKAVPKGTHSAPGRLLEVAVRLTERSERILHSAKSVEECVHGALLALEAQELLGNRTPTTALEALALRQELEVSAECMFYGVEHNFDVERRFSDIKREVRGIGHWFHRPTRRECELNAEINIVNRVLQRFRAHAQFDEEQACLSRIRTLRRGLWFAKNRTWAWLAYPARWYVETLIGSLSLFLLFMLLWPVVLAVAFMLSGVNFGDAIMNALGSFFGMQPPSEQPSPVVVTLAVMGILMGFTHLGIFVSHLYSLLSRR